MAYPSLLRRCLAAGVDFGVVLILLYLYAHSSLYDEKARPTYWPLLLFVVYEPVCYRYGCTLGQLLFRIRVRTNPQRDRVPVWRGLVRVFVKFLLGWHSIIKMPRDPQRRGLHDVIARTVVLEARSVLPVEPPNLRWSGP
jgi:uncharacterized RDD family membrane protein YckC